MSDQRIVAVGRLCLMEEDMMSVREKIKVFLGGDVVREGRVVSNIEGDPIIGEGNIVQYIYNNRVLRFRGTATQFIFVSYGSILTVVMDTNSRGTKCSR